MNTTNAQSQEPIKPTDRPQYLKRPPKIYRDVFEGTWEAVDLRLSASAVQLDALIRALPLQNPTVPNGE